MKRINPQRFVAHALIIEQQFTEKELVLAVGYALLPDDML